MPPLRSSSSSFRRAPPPATATLLLPSAPVTVASLAATLRSVPPGSPGPPAVAASLSRIDSRALAALLKELRFFRGGSGGGGNVGGGNSSNNFVVVDRATELFDWLRSLPFPGNPLAARLLDVYTYTTAIAACGGGSGGGGGGGGGGSGGSSGNHSPSPASARAAASAAASAAAATARRSGRWKPRGGRNRVSLLCGRGGSGSERGGSSGFEEECEGGGIGGCESGGDDACFFYERDGTESFEEPRLASQSPSLGTARRSPTPPPPRNNPSSSADLPRALALFEEMHSRGIEANVHSWSALINVAARAGEGEEGEGEEEGDEDFGGGGFGGEIRQTPLSLSLQLVERMVSSGLTPNLVTFNTLVDAHARAGRWRACLLLMLPGGVDFGGRSGGGGSVGGGVSGGFNNSNAFGGLTSLNSSAMERAGVRPEARTFNAALSAAARGVALENARAAAKRARGGGGRGGEPRARGRIQKAAKGRSCRPSMPPRCSSAGCCAWASPRPPLPTPRSSRPLGGLEDLQTPSLLSRTRGREAARGTPWSSRRSLRRSSGAAGEARPLLFRPGMPRGCFRSSSRRRRPRGSCRTSRRCSWRPGRQPLRQQRQRIRSLLRRRRQKANRRKRKRKRGAGSAPKSPDAASRAPSERG